MYSDDSDDDYHYGRYNLSVLIDDYANGVNPLTKKAPFLRQTGGNRVLTMILISATEAFYLINSVMQGIVMANDNPDFLLFLVDSTETEKPNQENSDFHWTSELLTVLINARDSPSLTSILLYLDHDSNLFLLCSHCRTIEEVRAKSHLLTEKKGLSFNTEEIVQRWAAVHKNFDQKYVLTVSIALFLWKDKKTCSSVTSKFLISEEECVFVELQTRLNFTTLSKDTETHVKNLTAGRVGRIYKGYISSEAFTEAYFLSPYLTKHGWMSWGCSFNHYYLTAFVRQSHFSFLTILQPLDVWSWLCLVISYVLVTTLVYGRDSSLNIGDASFLGVSVLLEQSFQWHLRRYQMASGVSLLWILTTLFTNNFYKTELFSSITSPTTPSHPESISDLERYPNLPIYTTTKHYTYMKYAHSTLKDVVLIDMSAGLPANNSHERLRSRVVFLNGTDPEIVTNVSLRLKVRSDLESFVDVGMRDFAMIDYASDGDRVSALVQRATNFIPYFLPTQISPYITRIPWFGERNFIFNTFVQAIAALDETGHLSAWNAHENNADTVSVFKNFASQLQRTKEKLMGRSAGNYSDRTNYFALVNLVPKNRRNDIDSNVLKGISIGNFEIIFILFLVLCIMSVVSFLAEIFMRSRRRNQTRIDAKTKVISLYQRERRKCGCALGHKHVNSRNWMLD